MKKRLALAWLALCGSPALQAEPIPGLIAASIGHLSPTTSPQLGFNASAGSTVSLGGQGVAHTDTVGFCGIARYSAPTAFLATALSNQPLTVNLPGDDVYVYTCVNSSGTDGDFLMYALNAQGRERSAGDVAPRSVPDATLLERLEQAASRWLPR